MREIVIGLDTSSISDALREIDDYIRDLDQKSSDLSRDVARSIKNGADAGFGSAVADSWSYKDFGTYTNESATVFVNDESYGNTAVVSASGEDAFWAEFGTGVSYNGDEPYPSPPGRPAGVAKIGEYGKGHGKRKQWYFKDEDGLVRKSRGVPAQMPMYKAMMSTIQEIPKMAGGIFGR